MRKAIAIENSLISGKTTRRWGRFSLRTLLIFVALLGIGCGWFFVELRQADKQRRVVAAIREGLGDVQYDYQTDSEGHKDFGAAPPEPAWLRSLLGDDFFSSVVEIVSQGDHQRPFGAREYDWYLACPRLRKLYLSGDWVRNDDLAHLPDLADLSRLAIGGYITNTGLEHIARCTQLRELSIERTTGTPTGLMVFNSLAHLEELQLPYGQTDDAVVAALVKLRQLKRLTLNGPGVTDKGMASVGRLESLEQLHLWQTQVTDEGLQQLKGLRKIHKASIPRNIRDQGIDAISSWTELETVELDSPRITDKGLARLATCTRLRTLGLKAEQITDEGLKPLAACKNLVHLRINSRHVTDEAIDTLTTFQSLESVDIEDTMISRGGVSRLRRAMPNTLIISEFSDDALR